MLYVVYSVLCTKYTNRVARKFTCNLELIGLTKFSYMMLWLNPQFSFPNPFPYPFHCIHTQLYSLINRNVNVRASMHAANVKHTLRNKQIHFCTHLYNIHRKSEPKYSKSMLLLKFKVILVTAHKNNNKNNFGNARYSMLNTQCSILTFSARMTKGFKHLNKRQHPT